MNVADKLSYFRKEWRLLISFLLVYVIAVIFLFIFFPVEKALELLFLLFYMNFACTFFPLPTPQIIMEYGGTYDPVLIAVIGAVGTCMAGLIDYTIIDAIFSYKKVAQLKNTKSYKICAVLYDKIAFISLVFAGFTPIPFEPFRFLAGSTKYNRTKYVIAIFLGRAPRYYLLAKLQQMIQFPTSILVGSIIVIIIVGAIRMLWQRRIRSKDDVSVSE